MDATWGSVLTKLIALGAVIALSPITVIPAVLVLHAPRPRPTGVAFLVGWVLGLTALTAVFVSGSGLLGALHKAPPTWAAWLRVVLGSALILLGAYQWLTRHRHGSMPRWMRSFSTLAPARAGVTGAVLVLRPEVLLLCAAAGLAVGDSSLSIAGQLLAAAFFLIIAVSTVGVPILGYVGAGDRLDNALERLKVWMEEHHAAMLAVILVLIGMFVLYHGIHAL